MVANPILLLTTSPFVDSSLGALWEQSETSAPASGSILGHVYVVQAKEKQRNAASVYCSEYKSVTEALQRQFGQGVMK